MLILCQPGNNSSCVVILVCVKRRLNCCFRFVYWIGVKSVACFGFDKNIVNGELSTLVLICRWCTLCNNKFGFSIGQTATIPINIECCYTIKKCCYKRYIKSWRGKEYKKRHEYADTENWNSHGGIKLSAPMQRRKCSYFCEPMSILTL